MPRWSSSPVTSRRHRRLAVARGVMGLVGLTVASRVDGDHLAAVGLQRVDHAGRHPVHVAVGGEPVVQQHRRPAVRGSGPPLEGDAGAVEGRERSCMAAEHVAYGEAVAWPAVPEPRRYFVRTFGCQMNEHDSERIAGLLEADGMTPADDLADADVVVLNTCCIRENADNKLYGHLGHLKAEKARRPDLQIVVGGCLAQKDRDLDRRAGAARRRRLRHPQRAPGRRAARRVGGQPTDRSSRSSTPPTPTTPRRSRRRCPVRREVPWAAWVTIQIGCDNRCAFCIVPSVRGKEISRTIDDIVAEVEAAAADGVTEVTLLGQNVNSYGRDLTRRRPLFAELLQRVGAVDGIRRVRYTSPHPKDLRPETIEAMATTPAVCEHLHLPLQSGSDRVLAAMHRGYTAERYLAPPRRRPRRRSPTSPSRPTSSSGFPGETDDDFERTLEVVAEAAYDSAYTFIFSPRPGTEAATMADRFVDPPRSSPSASSGSGSSSSAAPSPATRPASAGSRRSSSRARRSATRPCTTGRTRQNKLVHFDRRRCVRAPTHDVAGDRGRRPPPRRRARRRHRTGAAPHAHPRRRGVSDAHASSPTPLRRPGRRRALVAALDADLDERYAGDADDVDDTVDRTHAEPPRRRRRTAARAPSSSPASTASPSAAARCGRSRRRGADVAEVKRMYVVPDRPAAGGVARAVLAALEAGRRRPRLHAARARDRHPAAGGDGAVRDAPAGRRSRNYGAYRLSPLSRCYEKRAATRATSALPDCWPEAVEHASLPLGLARGRALAGAARRTVGVAASPSRPGRARPRRPGAAARGCRRWACIDSSVRPCLAGLLR